MYCTHELGHVVGAFVTGGQVESVALSPLTISQTILSSNPSPLIVVWLGPIVGSFLPLVVCLFVPSRFTALKKLAYFFAGFCLVANGAYIGFGSIELVGDCVEMHRAGTPSWLMILYGAVSFVAGLLTWHLLGSPDNYFARKNQINGRTSVFCLLVACLSFIVLQFFD